MGKISKTLWSRRKVCCQTVGMAHQLRTKTSMKQNSTFLYGTGRKEQKLEEIKAGREEENWGSHGMGFDIKRYLRLFSLSSLSPLSKPRVLSGSHLCQSEPLPCGKGKGPRPPAAMRCWLSVIALLFLNMDRLLLRPFNFKTSPTGLCTGGRSGS